MSGPPSGPPTGPATDPSTSPPRARPRRRRKVGPNRRLKSRPKSPKAKRLPTTPPRRWANGSICRLECWRFNRASVPANAVPSTSGQQTEPPWRLLT